MEQEYLLHHYAITGNEAALKAVTYTLDNMANGGIYDQIGGGFARYSTDMYWKVPHFEKMLYDNGQLVSLYSDAYKLTKNPLYKEVIEKTLQFVSKELINKGVSPSEIARTLARNHATILHLLTVENSKEVKEEVKVEEVRKSFKL